MNTLTKIYRKNRFMSGKVAALVFLGMVLSACTDGTQDTGPDEDVDLENPSGEIEVWGWNVAAASLNIAAERFMDEHPDTDITVRDIGDSDLYERLTVGMGSGGSGLPDLFMIHSDELASYAEQFPDQFLNLSEWGFEEHEDLFTEFKLEIITNNDGDVVAMPWDIGPAGVFYRVDYFEEAGVDPDEIETWDDYMEAGETIKETVGADLLPIEVSTNDSVYRIMLNLQGASYFNEEEEINLHSEESQRAMEVIQEMYQRDLVAHVNDWDAQIGVVANGDVATIPIGVWYSGTIMDQAPDLEGEWDVFEMPAFEEGGNRAANTGGSDLGIPSSSENPELAYAFAEYFVTDTELQVEVFEEYGLFPSLLSAYDDPFFDENVSYFNDSPIYSLFAEIAEDVEPGVYTEDFPRAQDVIVDTQSTILLDNTDVSEALEEAVNRLESETGRDRAN